VIPFRVGTNGEPQYLLFKRADKKVWQWIAGGGEDEEPQQTAAAKLLRKQAFLETLIYCNWIRCLNSGATFCRPSSLGW